MPREIADLLNRRCRKWFLTMLCFIRSTFRNLRLSSDFSRRTDKNSFRTFKSLFRFHTPKSNFIKSMILITICWLRDIIFQGICVKVVNILSKWKAYLFLGPWRMNKIEIWKVKGVSFLCAFYRSDNAP